MYRHSRRARSNKAASTPEAPPDEPPDEPEGEPGLSGSRAAARAAIACNTVAVPKHTAAPRAHTIPKSTKRL